MSIISSCWTGTGPSLQNCLKMDKKLLLVHLSTTSFWSSFASYVKCRGEQSSDQCLIKMKMAYKKIVFNITDASILGFKNKLDAYILGL